jgi:hypothetical protein
LPCEPRVGVQGRESRREPSAEARSEDREAVGWSGGLEGAVYLFGTALETDRPLGGGARRSGEGGGIQIGGGFPVLMSLAHAARPCLAETDSSGLRSSGGPTWTDGCT